MAWKQGPVTQRDTPQASLPSLARRVLIISKADGQTAKETPITQDNNANPHEHTVVEIMVYPGDSPLRRNAEVCACGAQRLVDLEGKPTGGWRRTRGWGGCCA